MNSALFTFLPLAITILMTSSGKTHAAGIPGITHSWDVNEEVSLASPILNPDESEVIFTRLTKRFRKPTALGRFPDGGVRSLTPSDWEVLAVDTKSHKTRQITAQKAALGKIKTKSKPYGHLVCTLSQSRCHSTPPAHENSPKISSPSWSPLPKNLALVAAGRP